MRTEIYTNKNLNADSVLSGNTSGPPPPSKEKGSPWSAKAKGLFILCLLLTLSTGSLLAQQTTEALNIDWSTYFGGNGYESPFKTKLVGSSLYVVGETRSPNLPVTNGSTYTGGGANVVYFARYDTATGTLQAASYFGGSGGNTTLSSVDIVGTDVFIAGTTRATTLPVTNGSILKGTQDIFYARLDGNTGNALTATYLGGSGNEYMYRDMKVVGSEVHIAGETPSTDFPVTNGSTPGGGTQDAFYARLDAITGNVLTATYLGGNAYDGISCMEVVGNMVYVGGSSSSSIDFPITTGPAKNVGTD
jgi:trimeric autotransporter adhesin